jgi:hypothetical protein
VYEQPQPMPEPIVEPIEEMVVEEEPQVVMPQEEVLEIEQVIETKE